MDAIKDILVKYKIMTSKVLQKGKTHAELQLGKEITIYYQEQSVDWEAMLSEMTEALISRNVQPGYLPINDKAIEGVFF